MTEIEGLRCTWDFKDRLVAAENAQMRAEYTYDCTDRRIMKQVWPKAATNSQLSTLNSQPTSVLYPSSLFEVRENDAPVKYVWNGSTRIARVTGPLSHRPLIQRLRLYPGWNLVSLAVSGPLMVLNTPAVQQAYRWDGTSKTFLPVPLSQSFSAGDVLWLRATEGVMVVAVGAYAVPVARTVPAGDQFMPCAGLQPWNISGNLPDTAAAWAYRLPEMQWLWRPEKTFPRASDFPALFTPGQAFFVRSGSSFTLPVPANSLNIRYYHQDHIGSTALIADTQGSLVEETVNYVFGYARHSHRPGGLVESYGFTQKERDSESGLHYFDARYVTSTLGRFSCADPLTSQIPTGWLARPQRGNPYAYCANRPTVCVDPTGLSDELTDEQREGLRQIQAMNEAITAIAKAAIAHEEQRQESQFTAQQYQRISELGGGRECTGEPLSFRILKLEAQQRAAGTPTAGGPRTGRPIGAEAAENAEKLKLIAETGASGTVFMFAHFVAYNGDPGIENMRKASAGGAVVDNGVGKGAQGYDSRPGFEWQLEKQPLVTDVGSLPPPRGPLLQPPNWRPTEHDRSVEMFRASRPQKSNEE